MSDERWMITDELWDFVEPLIPKNQRRFRYPGRTRLPDREATRPRGALRFDPPRGGEISLS